MTIAEKFHRTAEQNSSKDALAFLSGNIYQVIKYSQLENYRQQLAKFFLDHGLKKGDKVAVLLYNCPQWIMTDLAAATIGVIVVPIHTTYNDQFVRNIIVHSGASHIVVSDELYSKFGKLLSEFGLKNLFVVGTAKKDNAIIKFPTYKNLAALAKYDGFEAEEDDVHTIIYTSGTTGEPKGVMLSHKNLISNAESALRSIAISNKDRFFSFLPLSHAFERMAGYYAPLFAGAGVYFSTGPANLVSEIAIAKPTIMTAVPRIFEKVYDKIFDKIKSGSEIRKKMFFFALDLSRKNKVSRIGFVKKVILAFLDSVVLKKIRKVLGGRVRLAISGGASLNPRIAKFFDIVGINILEGYGMTETSPIICVNRLDAYKFGTVGKPIDCNEIKIADNKEILVRGENIMKGYYNNKEQTDMILERGWLYTGDLGFIDSEGFLTIIGRAKDVIVLPNGKNIFPEPIESALNESPFISQSMVYQDHHHLAAVIVPDFKELDKWAATKGIHEYKDKLNEYSAIRELYQYEINRFLGELSSVEMIRSFTLIVREFSQENGLLTPTLKLRRRKILETMEK